MAETSRNDMAIPGGCAGNEVERDLIVERLRLAVERSHHSTVGVIPL
jgi:hypothetical protein